MISKMTGYAIIAKLGSKFFKFEEDKKAKKKGARINTKCYARIAKRKLNKYLEGNDKTELLEIK